MYGYLWRVLGDRLVAADLCQETFLRAWRRLDRVGEYEGPLGWLLRVATNLALNHRRRGRRRVGVPVALNEENSPALGDLAPGVVEHLLVHQVLLALPANMRAALVLREVYGLEMAEVARTLGISHAAAKMLLSRARERFRERRAGRARDLAACGRGGRGASRAIPPVCVRGEGSIEVTGDA